MSTLILQNDLRIVRIEILQALREINNYFNISKSDDIMDQQASLKIYSTALPSVSKVASLLGQLGRQTADNFADGKFAMIDIANYFDELLQLPEVIKAVNTVDDEAGLATVPALVPIFDGVYAELVSTGNINPLVARAIAGQLEAAFCIYAYAKQRGAAEERAKLLAKK